MRPGPRTVPTPARATAAALAILFLAGTAAGSAAAGDDRGASDALRGPSVAGRATEATLVARGLEGEILPLDAPPAIAALDLIDFDEATEQTLHDLLAERAAIMDSIVLSNIELLTEIETVFAVGSPGEKLQMAQRGLAALAPARAWGRLPDRIAEALPPAPRARFERLVDEYERARLDHAARTGAAERRFEHRMARYWEDMTWELQRAAERVLEDDGDGDAWIRKLTERLGLTPDQEGRIRAMGERFFIETGGRPDETQIASFIAQVRTVLTVEQRWAFTAMILRGELEPGEDD